MIIELEQDAISRGADLTLLSQYPHESRVVFAPSCLLQLVELRVDTHMLSSARLKSQGTYDSLSV